MSLSLSQALTSVPQREVAGSRSSKLFAYQKNWALAELLEYHLLGKDYVFAFEFHDDVLILDSELEPQKLTFVQVKARTNDKPWPLSELLQVKKGKGGNPDSISIIGKLYQNQQNFDTYQSELKFVTNAFFKFTNGGYSSCADKLSQENQSKIEESVSKQLSTINEIELGRLFFERTDLSYEDHERHIKGKLIDFFSSVLGNDHNVSIIPWYQSLSDQIKKKNDYSPDKVSNFEELIRNKCITRREIDRFFGEVLSTKKNEGSWEILEKQLATEGVDYRTVITLKSKWKQYASDRLDYDNELIQHANRLIKAELVNARAPTIIETVKAVKVAISTDISKLLELYGDDYLTVMIMWLDSEQL